MHDRTAMDKRDEEILELKQKLIDLMKENNEMKELVLFLDEERNFARQFMRDANNKQSLNWNSLKQKLAYLEQKQFELIRENYSLKQVSQSSAVESQLANIQIHAHSFASFWTKTPQVRKCFRPQRTSRQIR